MESVNVYARGGQSPVIAYNNTILPQNIVGKRNVLVQGMMTTPNTRYIIKWDFDLDGQAITIPDGCMLSFEGGSLFNGTVNINGAGISPDYNTLTDGSNISIEGYPKSGVCRWDSENNMPLWSTGGSWVNALGGSVETE